VRFEFKDKYDWRPYFTWWPTLAVDASKEKSIHPQQGYSPSSLKWIWLEWIERNKVVCVKQTTKAASCGGHTDLMPKPSAAENRYFDQLGAWLQSDWRPCPIYPDERAVERSHPRGVAEWGAGPA